MKVKVFGSWIRLDESLLEADEEKIRADIQSYLRRNLKEFNYKIDYERVDQPLRNLMKVLSKIPYGKVRTYGEVGKELGMHPRKVGSLCSKNPLPIIVPCHRVVGKRDIGGYSYGKELKIQLLRHERATLS